MPKPIYFKRRFIKESPADDLHRIDWEHNASGVLTTLDYRAVAMPTNGSRRLELSITNNGAADVSVLITMDGLMPSLLFGVVPANYIYANIPTGFSVAAASGISASGVMDCDFEAMGIYLLSDTPGADIDAIVVVTGWTG